MKSVALQLWKICISLKLAVTIIVVLTVSLMCATFVESGYGTKTAQYFFYRSGWFFLILIALGINILCVAISRYPWKPKHAPFLMAHAGILMILFGSAATYYRGIDGSIRLDEGEVSSAVELDAQVVSIARGDVVDLHEVSWLPTVLENRFKPLVFKDLGVVVDRFIADAEAKISFVAPDEQTNQAGAPVGTAIKIKILAAPMGGAPEFWLWNGDAAWASQSLGPARFTLLPSNKEKPTPVENTNPLPPSEAGPTEVGQTAVNQTAVNQAEARMDFYMGKKGELHYLATSIRGEKKSGVVKLVDDEPVLIQPGWRMPIEVQVKKIIPRSVNQTVYQSKFSDAGMGAGPSPAVRLSLLSSPGVYLWLGLGDRADLKTPTGETVGVGYYPKRIILPFALRLKTFEVIKDPGTQNPASYASQVQVVRDFKKDDEALNAIPEHNISMNEPMKESFYTFYQASFIPGFPRPTTTVLSVNFDPGRTLKYSGSLLLVLGAILLFVIKSFKKKSVSEGGV